MKKNTKKIQKIAIPFAVLVFMFLCYQSAQADWIEGLSVAGSFGLPNAPGFGAVVDGLLLWLLAVFTLLAVISFVVTGIMYFAAGSNQEMAEKAKSGLTMSIIGVAIGLSGYVIVYFIDSVLLGYPM
jgi:hypothetical protein